ncbi:MAG TPA: hypothetical protein DDX92_01090 [Flavobacteriales bacterium]|jgi:hypothetical protein|nr:hypothetical protein [Flavobacteriales bacterium]
MKKIGIVLLMLFLASYTYAQDDYARTSPAQNPKPKAQGPSFTDKLFFGGGVELNFGNDVTVLGLLPMVGYRATERLQIGAMITYRYIEYKNLNYSANFWGLAPFSRYLIYRGLFAHVEYETLYGDWNGNDNPFFVNSFFVGGGYMIPVGRNGFASVYLLYNVIDSEYSIYSNPVIRINFGLGF